jgi:uncharacterized protein (DUF58 family)
MQTFDRAEMIPSRREENKMMMRIYKVIWVAFAVLAAVIFAAGAMTGWTLYAMGVALFGMIYFGMMFVLPLAAAHPEMVALPEPDATVANVPEAVHAHRWQTNDVALRQLKFH